MSVCEMTVSSSFSKGDVEANYRDVSTRVDETFYERNGPWQAFTCELRQTLMFLHFEITSQLAQYKASKHKP